jgi:hypothetical protein
VKPLGINTSIAPQELLLDTGSSTLAFCDSDMAEQVCASRTEFVSCNKYGNSKTPSGYWGSFFIGDVIIGDNLWLHDSSFSIMEQETRMPCTGTLQGIFGVAFRQLDQAAKLSDLTKWPQGTVGQCPLPVTNVIGPLVRYLKQDTPSGRLGIFWSGQVGRNQGELFVGARAVTNKYYIENVVQQAALGALGYYDISIQQFLFEGHSYKVSCGGKTTCILDTGTPIMYVPQAAYSAMRAEQQGTLHLQLAGPSGKTAMLAFDVKILVERNWLAPFQDELESFIIGLPLWAFYYTVFNIDGRVVEFVPHKASTLMPSALFNNLIDNTDANSKPGEGATKQMMQHVGAVSGFVDRGQFSCAKPVFQVSAKGNPGSETAMSTTSTPISGSHFQHIFTAILLSVVGSASSPS